MRASVAEYEVTHPGVDLYTEPCEAAAQLSVEQTIFDSLSPITSRLRIWQPLPALIVTAGEADQPAFTAAAEQARTRGLTVLVRKSGGGAVCLGPGTLVVTHLYCSAHNDILDSYRAFAQRLSTAIATIGIALSEQRVPHAYCDGSFDLAWRGLKVGGIAQRRRRLGSRTQVWIHAVLSVERESLGYPASVAQFYAALGSSRIADPRSTTSLSECLPVGAPPERLLQRCSEAIVAAFQCPTS